MSSDNTDSLSSPVTSQPFLPPASIWEKMGDKERKEHLKAVTDKMTHEEILSELEKRGLDESGKELSTSKSADENKKEEIRAQGEATKKSELEEKEAIMAQEDAPINAKIASKMESMKMDQEETGENETDGLNDPTYNRQVRFSKSFNFKTIYYIIIAGILLFSLGFYSLIGTDMEASDSAKILTLSLILFSFGILLFSMYLMVKGVEDKEENEWVRIAMILGGVYMIDKWLDLYEPVSLFIEIINIVASFF